METHDKLLASIKEALSLCSELKKVSVLDADQSLARTCVVTDLLNALAHAHNLIISIEKGTSPFWSVPYPKEIKVSQPKGIPYTDSERERDVTKLQLKLQRMQEELEKLGGSDEEGSQTELFPR